MNIFHLPKSRINFLTIGVLAGSVIHLGIVVAYIRNINWDVAQYVSMAQLILDGAIPFRDILDVNPPLIMYLSIVPVCLADALPLDIVRSTNLAVVLFLLLTWLVSSWCLKFLNMEDLRSARVVLAAIWIYLAANVLMVSLFGQRDQLIAVSLVPYVVLRAAAMRRRIPSMLPDLAAGVLAAVALLLKPMYGTIILSVECGLLLNKGWRAYFNQLRILFVMLGTVLVLYTALEPLRIYAFEWWGVIVSYYEAYGYDVKMTLFKFVRQQEYQFATFFFALAFALRTSIKSVAFRNLLLMLILFGVGTFLGMLIQGKLWEYHLLPMLYALWLVAAFTLYALLSERGYRTTGTKTAAFWTVIILAGLQLTLFPRITSWLRIGPPEAPYTTLQHVIEQHTTPNEYVVAVSPGVGVQFPSITFSGRRYASRYFCAFPLAMAYQDQEAQTPRPERRWIEDKYRTELWADISARRPALILVDTLEGQFLMPDTMSAKTWLIAQRFFDEGPGRDYYYLQNIGWGVAIYKRRD